METPTQWEAGAVAQGAIPELRFSTSDVGGSFGRWRECLALLFDGAKATPADDVSASLVVRHLGTFLLCRSFAGRARFCRSPTGVERSDIDHVVISCLLSGRIAAGGPVRRLHPGDIAVLDLATPTVFAMAAADALHLIVPRTALPAAVTSAAPMPCRIFDGGSAMAILMRGVIDSLFKASVCFSAVEAGALGACIPELLGCLLATPPALAGPAAARGDLGRRLRRHIEDNLNRTDLTSARVAREVGVSRSQLYRHFEASGGVERYIRRRRLRRSLQALTDPRRAGMRIGDIAFDVGFSDEAHFSRLFRQAYGQSPRDARAAARGEGGAVPVGPVLGQDADPSLAAWLTTLGLQ